MKKRVERLADLPAGAWRISNASPEEVERLHPDRDVVYYQGTPINGREWYVCAIIGKEKNAKLVVFLIAGGICLYGTWIMSVRLGW